MHLPNEQHVHKSIITNATHIRWHLTYNIACLRCKCHKETILHTLYDCDIIQNLWCSLARLEARSTFFFFLIVDHEQWLFSNLSGKLGSKGGFNWPIIFGVIIWKICQWHNSLVFHNKLILVGECGKVIMSNTQKIMEVMTINQKVSNQKSKLSVQGDYDWMSPS